MLIPLEMPPAPASLARPPRSEQLNIRLTPAEIRAIKTAAAAAAARLTVTDLIRVRVLGIKINEGGNDLTAG